MALVARRCLLVAAIGLLHFGGAVQIMDKVPRPDLQAHHVVIDCKSAQGGPPDAPEWIVRHREAFAIMCADPWNQLFMEVRVDSRFQHNLRRIARADGWIENAWVTYVEAGPLRASTWEPQVHSLVSGIHRFSAYPIVLLNFGSYGFPNLDPGHLRNLVMLRARSVRTIGADLSFNKIQAILLSRVKVGVALDADMLPLGPQADSLFSSARREIDEQYPFPLMPVGGTDRDPESDSTWPHKFKPFKCAACPRHLSRWGKAQVGWTYWSFPFFARWQAAKLGRRAENGVPTDDLPHAEELLNVALWSEDAAKQWCTWEVVGTEFAQRDYFGQHAPTYPFNADPKYYPEGIPVAYYFAHLNEDEDEMNAENLVRFLGEFKKTEAPWPKPYSHNLKFYNKFSELVADTPQRPHCVL